MNTLMKTLSAPFKEILKVLYPNKCIACGEIIDENEFLCTHCYNNIENLDKAKLCLSCGQEKKDCICSHRVYRFVGVVSAFANADIAKTAYYAYKFGQKIQYSDFFAERMALTVKTKYFNKKFDYICAVPTSYSSRFKYGFDHCDTLCKRLSEILNLIKLDGVLGCKRVIKSQHHSGYVERIHNVRGKYFYSKKISGGRVLLVDDILTTGATLDECARQLLLAGADEVYCVTALITKPKKVEKQQNI